MVFIQGWATYLPTNKKVVEGKELPAPSKDEDEISMAYEVLSRMELPNGVRMIFVNDDGEKDVDFHIVADLIEAPTSTVSVFSSLDDALEYSLSSVPSVMTVVRSEPPAGAAAIQFRKRGPIKIVAHETRKEAMGFLRTSLTDERALSDLLSEVTLSKMPGILKKFIHRRKSRKHNVKIISGYMRKPKILLKAISSLKLKDIDISPALEVINAGYKGNLAAAFSLIKALEKCDDSEEVLFIGEASSGGVYVMIMQCNTGWLL
jgi:hypothetical protein